MSGSHQKSRSQVRSEAKAMAAQSRAYQKAMRPWWKRKRVIIPAGLLGLAAIGSATGGSNDPSTASGTLASDQSQETPAFAGAKPGDIWGPAGETLILDDLQIEATPLDPASQPYGKDQLCSTVTYTNTGDGKATFNPLDWELQDPDGAILMSTFGGSQDYLRSGELRAGGTVSGDVCFDDHGSGDYVLFVAPFLSDRGAWLNTR